MRLIIAILLFGFTCVKLESQTIKIYGETISDTGPFQFVFNGATLSLLAGAQAASQNLTNWSNLDTNTLSGKQATLGFTPITNSFTALTNTLGFVPATNGVGGAGDLLAANNLSDVASIATARSNLGANNADNISSGTLADARIAATITRDSEAAAAYQPLDSDLTTIAGLTPTTDNFVVAAASAWASRTPAQAKTSLALVKGDVGLGAVDNTSDAGKPVSTAQQTQLDLKANLAGPTFTGTPAAPTAAAGTATTQLATTAFADAVKDYGSFKTITHASGSHIAARVAGTYFLGHGDAAGITGTGTLYPPVLIHIAGADYPTVNGVAAKLRIRTVLAVNDVAPTGNFTFGLYPVTRPATSGGAGLDIYTMGTVVSGSNGATYTTPAADSLGTAVSADFALPADGVYVIGVVTTATVATSSHLHMTGMLQYHNN